MKLVPDAGVRPAYFAWNVTLIAAEILQENDPAEYERLCKQGYLPESQTNAPAVISFTTKVARICDQRTAAAASADIWALIV